MKSSLGRNIQHYRGVARGNVERRKIPHPANLEPQTATRAPRQAPPCSLRHQKDVLVKLRNWCHKKQQINVYSNWATNSIAHIITKRMLHTPLPTSVNSGRLIPGV